MSKVTTPQDAHTVIVALARTLQGSEMKSLLVNFRKTKFTAT